MKTSKPFFLSVLGSLRFGWQVIRYALTFVSAFFRQLASLGREMVAFRSQLTFSKQSIRQKKQRRPRLTPAFMVQCQLFPQEEILRGKNGAGLEETAQESDNVQTEVVKGQEGTRKGIA